MLPHQRRKLGFHAPNFGLQGLTMRARSVLPLRVMTAEGGGGDHPAVAAALAALPSLRAAVAHPAFSAVVVLRGDQLLYEAYADDFGPERPHSMQSITKTTVHLLIGSLLERGKLSLGATIEELLGPSADVGSGYASATLQQVLDMAVSNDFVEDYAGNPYCVFPPSGSASGYSSQEVAMGWRLPPPSATNRDSTLSMRDYIRRIRRTQTGTDTTGYKSPNNDLLGWCAPRSKHPPHNPP
jgi:CubicO group peptidase (beta-lactamase class C family)